MFSAAQYLQGAKTSSFLIRDILGADGTITSAAKYAGLDPGFVGMPGQAYLGQPFSSAQSLAPYQNSLCYQDVRRAAYSIDSLLEPNFKDSSPSIPIPLPVYIRTRSPPGSDVFGKAKRCRRSRTVFTELQLMGLEKRFDDQKYLSTPDRMDLADSLGLTQLQVKTWYQNRRMKWKKQVLQSGCKEAPTKPKGRPKKDSCADEGGESLDTKLLNEGRQHQSDSIDTTSTGAICHVTNNVANQYAGLYQIGGVPHVT